MGPLIPGFFLGVLASLIAIKLREQEKKDEGV